MVANLSRRPTAGLTVQLPKDYMTARPILGPEVAEPAAAYAPVAELAPRQFLVIELIR